MSYSVNLSPQEKFRAPRYIDQLFPHEVDDSVSPDSPPYVLCKNEVDFYYLGLSRYQAPRLIYRTSKTREPWVEPTGLWTVYPNKELRPVFGHKLNEEWKNVGPKVRDLLDEQHVRFTSIDVVRLRTEVDMRYFVTGPVIIWIGVCPGSLLGEDAFNSANSLLELLRSHDITDVDIEFRESVYRRLAGPELYKPVGTGDLTDRKFIDPLSTALGLPISGERTPDLQGTMGFYFQDGEDLFGVTARHVLFPTDECNYDFTFINDAAPRREVLLMGNKAFKDHLRSIMVEIGCMGNQTELWGDVIKRCEETISRNDVDDAEKAREKEEMTTYQQAINEKRYDEPIEKLSELHQRLMDDWGFPGDRIIGHDYAIIKLDKDKFKNSFMGNVLNSDINWEKFFDKMRTYKDGKICSNFRCSPTGLLPLGDIIPENFLHDVDEVNVEGERCLYLIKHGHSTLTTIGRASGIYSYTREYFANQTYRDSMQWPILPYGVYKPFADEGDSGSIIVDSLGRFGGLLTGGSGIEKSIDIIYAMPFWWLWPLIQEQFPNATLCPALA
ncbi:hypothetical protein H0H93_004049 [Arthromyces matolae]|nr:hypothetical protein H0H93_004049 [Arthromyces matolae]